MEQKRGFLKNSIIYEGVLMEKPKNYVGHPDNGPAVEKYLTALKGWETAMFSAPHLTAIGFPENFDGLVEYETGWQELISPRGAKEEVWKSVNRRWYDHLAEDRRRKIAIPLSTVKEEVFVTQEDGERAIKAVNNFAHNMETYPVKFILELINDYCSDDQKKQLFESIQPAKQGEYNPESGSDLDLRWKLSMGSDKPINISKFRELLDQFDREEISMSRLVEHLNIRSYKWATTRKSEMSDDVRNIIEEEASWRSTNGHGGVDEITRSNFIIAAEYGYSLRPVHPADTGDQPKTISVTVQQLVELWEACDKRIAECIEYPYGRNGGYVNKNMEEYLQAQFNINLEDIK